MNADLNELTSQDSAIIDILREKDMMGRNELWARVNSKHSDQFPGGMHQFSQTLDLLVSKEIVKKDQEESKPTKYYLARTVRLNLKNNSLPETKKPDYEVLWLLPKIGRANVLIIYHVWDIEEKYPIQYFLSEDCKVSYVLGLSEYIPDGETTIIGPIDIVYSGYTDGINPPIQLEKFEFHDDMGGYLLIKDL